MEPPWNVNFPIVYTFCAWPIFRFTGKSARCLNRLNRNTILPLGVFADPLGATIKFSFHSKKTDPIRPMVQSIFRPFVTSSFRWKLIAWLIDQYSFVSCGYFFMSIDTDVSPIRDSFWLLSFVMLGKWETPLILWRPSRTIEMNSTKFFVTLQSSYSKQLYLHGI